MTLVATAITIAFPTFYGHQTCSFLVCLMAPPVTLLTTLGKG